MILEKLFTLKLSLFNWSGEWIAILSLLLSYTHIHTGTRMHSHTYTHAQTHIHTQTYTHTQPSDLTETDRIVNNSATAIARTY